MSKRALLTLFAAAALALAAGVVTTAKPAPDRSPSLANQLASARMATAKYVSNLGKAKAEGYRIITRMIPDMGFHYMNPDLKDFDVRRPPILVYERRGGNSQLAALEWVFPQKPAKPPLPGARYGSFPAACHYVDGTFVPQVSRSTAHRAARREPPSASGTETS